MKKTYKIEVDCANCANKMELAARKVPGVEEAVVNFMTQKMIITFCEDADIATVMTQVQKSCKKATRDGEIFL